MWCLYVSKVQLYIKSIFASPKRLNNGILLLRGAAWLRGEKEVLLGLLFWFGDLLDSPWQRRKWVGFVTVESGMAWRLVVCSCFAPGVLIL